MEFRLPREFRPPANCFDSSGLAPSQPVLARLAMSLWLPWVIHLCFFFVMHVKWIHEFCTLLSYYCIWLWPKWWLTSKWTVEDISHHTWTSAAAVCQWLFPPVEDSWFQHRWSLQGISSFRRIWDLNFSRTVDRLPHMHYDDFFRLYSNWQKDMSMYCLLIFLSSTYNSGNDYANLQTWHLWFEVSSSLDTHQTLCIFKIRKDPKFLQWFEPQIHSPGKRWIIFQAVDPM